MAPLGVVLATFGSAVTSDDVPAYLASVRGGREVPADLIEEFQRRYDRIGRSPLIDITLAQCAALQALLDRASDGDDTIMANIGHASRSMAAAEHARSHFRPILSDHQPVIGEQTVITTPPTMAAMKEADCCSLSTLTENVGI